MQLETITDFEKFSQLADEWNELLERCSASSVPFLRHEYLNTWWQTRGGGEWPQEAALHVVVGRSGGRLEAAAPLFFAPNRNGDPTLMLIGSIEISDYLDLLAPEAALPVFAELLLAHLDTEAGPDWQALDLYNLAEDSPTLRALQAAAELRGWRYAQEQLQPCPYIPLPGDWEAYLAGIDKKQRHEIRRKMRRAAEATPPANWYIVDDEARLDAEMDDFMALMAADPEKENFLTEAMRTQMKQSAHAAFQNGWLQLAFLESNGEKAAGYMNFDYANHIWVYNSGLSPNFRELSPGWVLLGYLLQWANENKRRAFDFMRGDEDYKYRFGGVNRYVVRVEIRRN